MVTGERVTRVLNLLREHYHYVLLDLPHDFRETTLAGLDLADEILLTMSPDLASVLSMASAFDVFETLKYPREVIKRALELSATALILVHNHPSGDPTPSQADIQMTKAIIDIARPLGIAVHDHIIVGKSGHASLKGLRLI